MFIGLGQPVAAHHGLDRLGHHFPGRIQISGNRGFVDLQLAQPGVQRLIRQHSVAQRDTHIAQHGAVGQVTLPAADGQLFAQVAQHRVGQAQIAFGVLEINRVDLVRHGGRTHLAVLELLLEIAQGHIAPDVSRPVDQDGIGAGHSVKQLGHVVMRFDLDAERLEVEPQAQWFGCLHHAFAESLPVVIGPGREVSVVIAHGAIHLGQNLDAGDAVRRRLQAHHYVGNLFTHGGGAGGLAVRAAEHGHIGKGVGHLAQFQEQPVQRR